MSGPDREPRPEDFGITEADLARAPSVLTSRCRPLLVVMLWATTLAVAFVAIYRATASPSAAALFSVILVAAGSIFLVPLLVGLVCASEKAETRWLCRRFPQLGACLDYRAAVVGFRRGRRPSSREVHDPGWWMALEPVAFCVQAARDLEGCGSVLKHPADRELAGYDFAFDDPRGRVLVRCEAGSEPVRLGVGRELVACLEETGAGRAMVISAADASPELAAYLADRPLVVLRPWELGGAGAAVTRPGP